MIRVFHNKASSKRFKLQNYKEFRVFPMKSVYKKNNVQLCVCVVKNIENSYNADDNNKKKKN